MDLRQVALLVLACAGCDSGFGVRVDITSGCVAADDGVDLEIVVTTQPGSRMETRAVKGSFLAQEPRIVVVPPGDATLVTVKVTAKQGQSTIATASIDVPIEGHKLVSTTLILNGPGCGDAGVGDLAGADRTPPPDLAVRCTVVSFCQPPTPACDPGSGACVGCLRDEHCPSGAVCDVNAKECIPGCNAMHPCGDAGACVDGGMCKFCTQDSDCAKPTGRCLKSTGACVECLGGGDCKMGEVCAGNVCRAMCVNDGQCLQAPFTSCCAMACVDQSSDPLNCGGCGVTCSLQHATAKCQNGCKILACDQGFADCDKLAIDGCEVNVNVDAMNCLGCGQVCSAPNASSRCAGGCQIASCNNGFADCDGQYANGCEIDTRVSAGNCGGCGNVCGFPNGTPKCAGGSCVAGTCNQGFANCNGVVNDGCEVDLRSDHGNCGMCGRMCLVNEACMNGVCVGGMCNYPFADCDGMPGCETDLSNDPFHCGGCGIDCGGNNCLNGICQGGGDDGGPPDLAMDMSMPDDMASGLDGGTCGGKLACTQGKDPISMAPFVVCAGANKLSATVSWDVPGDQNSKYYPLAICNCLGYPAWGNPAGTGMVCGNGSCISINPPAMLMPNCNFDQQLMQPVCIGRHFWRCSLM